MISSNEENTAVETRLIAAAIDFVNRQSHGSPLAVDHAVTINFHPDAIFHEKSVMANLLADGIYRSQYETGISSGSLSPEVGGKRWTWEHSMFGGAYDHAPLSLRPKYGALNYRNISVGAAPRFGSCHLRLKPSIVERCTFAYPEFHLNPTDYGTCEHMNLFTKADANIALLEPLDNYIEAHVHGVVNIREDVDAIVLDPSFQDTPIETTAREFAINLEWHKGYCLTLDQYKDCVNYRGKVVADFIKRIAKGGQLTPALLGHHREKTDDAQLLKKAWHCMARFGLNT